MIAEVALNLPLRRTFDYAIAEAHRDQIVPGARVVVPLGSRLAGGVVVGVKAESAIPPARLKAIHQPVEGGAFFSEELLAFSRWVAAYYFCGWGEVLAAALPAGMGLKIRALYRLKDPAAPRNFPPPVCALLQGREEWDEPQWKKAGATAEDLRWLWRQRAPGGALAVRFEYAGPRRRPRLEKWVRLAGAVQAGPPPTPPRRPPRRRRNPVRETRKERVLRLLREEGEVPMARVSALVSAPGAIVKALREAGLIEVAERAVPPSPPPSGAPEPFLTLNDDQAGALAAIVPALAGGAYRGFLLEGVTGSGKTEVYLHAVREALALGKSCLLMVPEIALTDHMVNRFRARFPGRVAVLHSGMGEQERFEQWRRVHEGEADIVIGARSAVFAPLQRLGLVVVDEEHDGSYKQDEAPRYHARDAALMRALQNNAVAVLGTATPSLETSNNVATGKLTRIMLPVRIERRPLPVVEVLDLKTEPRQKGSPFFTRYLVDSLREVLLRGEQAILFLNRRGFASLVRCPGCQTAVVCDHCSITLTYHHTSGRLRCHRCDFTRPVPARCGKCGAAGLKVLGLGTQRVQQDVEMMFPDARVLRMDSDTLRRRGELERMMAAIRDRKYDVIIGTQVLSKGHDFPFITLVGAILADVSLNLPDFRAPERTFQLLTQMAGRAGRGKLPGRVLVQTYNPGHYALACVRNHDSAGFTGKELKIRAATASPPFCSQALLWVTGPAAPRVERLADELARRLKIAAGEGVKILGATEAPIIKIANRFRWMILLRAPAVGPIHRVLRQVLDDPGFRVGAKERVAVDIDPHHLM